jgi:hypothetical protein
MGSPSFLLSSVFIADVSELIEPAIHQMFDVGGNSEIVLDVYSTVKQLEEDLTFSGNTYRILYIVAYASRNKHLSREIYFLCNFNSVYPLAGVRIL